MSLFSVLCGLEESLDLFFCENKRADALTVNGERYRNRITQLFEPQLEDIVLEYLNFQLKGATCHTARATLNDLARVFFLVVPSIILVIRIGHHDVDLILFFY